ncbi:restriction modification system DNA specificity domain protein [Psychromonas ingrahamii 37]|uniref:Restriction modification system DNA specificity domain protein n=1 Tax=Psychromonas ingrahamii (strain DSM 17664 / CCUG 51855 / 37) TaxID=357804 RepID=A1SRA2_PSYIN|nr:restriction endonuclease subunit S [Psychromonas ingrahamii]ABM02017.1 restriction modification system DNA specificity domain protein [Psychromonas ingrahamii 37]
MEWKTEKLGNVCEIIKRGIAPKYVDEGGICVINQKCIRDHTVNYSLARRHNLIIKSVNEERYVQVGDVLINSTGTGTLGRVAQVRNMPIEPTTVDTHVTIVRPKNGLFHNDFFGYMLIKIEEEITSAGEGASGQTELARTKLQNDFFVSYPDSIQEQKRIVVLLDTVFADLEQTRTKTEQNLKNARELFDSYLQQLFSKKSEGWVEKTLSEIAHVGTGGTPLKSTIGFWGGDIPWYSSGELNDTYTLASKNKITEVGLSGSNAKLFPKGSLLIGMYDTAALKMSILDRDGTFNQAVAGVKPNPKINLEFILHSINVIKPELLKLRRGVRQKNLNQSKIKNIPIRLPTIAEQIKIVAEINDLEEKTNLLVNIYSQKITSIDELKKSILQKAFSGELSTVAK